MRKQILRAISFILTISMIFGMTVSLGLTASSAVAIVPEEVGEWTYVEEFDGAALPNGWSIGNAGNGSYAVSEGAVTLTPNSTSEYQLKYTGVYYAKVTSFIYEIEVEQSGTGRCWINAQNGSAYRFRCQLVKQSNGTNIYSTWTEGSETRTAKLYSGDITTLRFEYLSVGSSGYCLVFVNGDYFATSYLESNGATSQLIFIPSRSSADTEYSFSVKSVKLLWRNNVAPLNVGSWEYDEDFDGTLEDSGWVSNGKGSLSVENGDLVLSHNAKEEAWATFTPSVGKSDVYTLEYRGKFSFPNNGSILRLQSYLGNGWRIFSREMKTTTGMASGTVVDPVNFSCGSEYHTYKYDFYKFDDVQYCNSYIDGQFIAQYAMNSNNGSALIRFILNPQGTDEASATIDYVRFNRYTGYIGEQYYKDGVKAEAPSALPTLVASISDEQGGDKIDNLYLNAAISASETRDVGIIFSDTEASCEFGAQPLFIRVATEGHGRSANGFIQSGCYGSSVITASNLGGEEGDSLLALYWKDMPTDIGTVYARVFAKNPDGSYEYGDITPIVLEDGASVLPFA